MIKGWEGLWEVLGSSPNVDKKFTYKKNKKIKKDSYHIKGEKNTKL